MVESRKISTGGQKPTLDVTWTSRISRLASFPALLTVSVIGVYVLVILGATTSVTEAFASCSTWPTCDGRMLVSIDDPAAVALAHRAMGILVGIILLLTGWVGYRTGITGKTRLAFLIAIILYPIQGGIGAVTAISGTSQVVSIGHLVIAMLIFACLVVTLAWSLEDRYPEQQSTVVSAPGKIEQSREPSANPAALDGWRDTGQAYFRLMKPRLMWLLCLVAAAGMALAAGPTLQLTTIVATLSGGVLAIGAAGTFNHIIERDVDQQMERTADRPIATHLIPVTHAITFGLILAFASIAIFVLFVNWLAAALGLTAIVFYAVIYTIILKPNTVQNTVIGGAAGALPALIGWAAVTSSIGVPGLLLALVIFAWTPAHFYNLAIAFKDDYARGGFPMLPVVRGEQVARKHILLYAGVTLLTAAVLATASSLGWLYALASIVAGAGFLYMIVRLHQEQTRSAALRTFHASNAYLGVILIVVATDAILL